MSVLLDSVIRQTSDVTYSLVLNSNDRLLGTHNHATFNIDWEKFLPVDIKEYKVCYAFQSTGGRYTDGIFQKNPLAPTTGVTSVTTGASVSSSGTTSITFAASTGLVVGDYVYGVGIASDTTITVVTGNTVNLSTPVFGNIPIGASLQVVTAASVNSVSFSSARILANFGGKSYSYDTGGQGGQSLNIGNIARDTQTITSKSNTFSAFYCQYPPRTISRPINNLFIVSIFNNSVFQGGPTSYTNVNGVLSYGSTASTANFLCDTTNISQGAPVAGTMIADMSPWTMTLEFIPIDKKIKY